MLLDLNILIREVQECCQFLGFFLVANGRLACLSRCLGLESVPTIELDINLLLRRFCESYDIASFFVRASKSSRLIIEQRSACHRGLVCCVCIIICLSIIIENRECSKSIVKSFSIQMSVTKDKLKIAENWGLFHITIQKYYYFFENNIL